MKKLFIFAMLFLIVGCSSESSQLTPQPSFSETLTPQEIVVAKSAFDVFCKTCQPLMGEYSGDIEWIKIESYHDCTTDEGAHHDYRCADYGWDKYIYITLKIIDRTQLIPIDLRAFGHTEHIYIGGPENPGIITIKFPELCGGTRPLTGGPGFISAPDLSQIF